jgi:hypothetical protein
VKTSFDIEDKTYREAHDALRRLEATLAQGDNRYGEYGRRVREAIESHRGTIRRIEARRPRRGKDSAMT